MRANLSVGFSGNPLKVGLIFYRIPFDEGAGYFLFLAVSPYRHADLFARRKSQQFSAKNKELAPGKQIILMT